jgi:hypothetical protein
MARSALLALTFAALLALSACLTHPALEKAPDSPAPAAQPETPPTQPSPVPFRAVPPEPTPAPATTAAAAAPSAAPSTPLAPQKPTPSAPKTPSKQATPTLTPESKPPTAAAKAASLDLNALEQRLKDTRAIGVFTKLSLKNQVDDLLNELREFHKGSSKLAQPMLRQKYDLLIMKVLSLLQNGDPPLAAAIASSREAIWQILMDPDKFANI